MKMNFIMGGKFNFKHTAESGEFTKVDIRALKKASFNHVKLKDSIVPISNYSVGIHLLDMSYTKIIKI